MPVNYSVLRVGDPWSRHHGDATAIWQHVVLLPVAAQALRLRLQLNPARWQ